MHCNQTDTGMPTKDFEANLPQELNMWAANVFAKIKKNFRDYEINTTLNKKEGYTGDLYRRMWWTVHNAAGGKKSLIQFFYMKYGDYVHWGVGSRFDDPRRQLNPPQGQKLWDVPPVRNKGKQPIPYKEPYNTSNGHRYASKPYLRREVRYQMRTLIRDLAVRYAFFADFYTVRGIADGIGDPSITTKWIQQNKMHLTNDFLDMMGMKR